jgi:hypothetical protein
MAQNTYVVGEGVIRRRPLTGRIAAAVVGVLFAVALSISLSASAATSTVVVMGDTAAGENEPGWLFNRDPRTTTPYEFNTDAASIGAGSLYVEPIANDYDAGFGTCKSGVDQTGCNKFIAENFLLTPVADVNSISYDFQIGSAGAEADKVHFYMNVYANFGESSDTKFYDCRYNVVPTVGSTGGFTTVTFDPTQAYSVTTRTGTEASPHTCPAVPADMDTLSPGSTIRAFAINLGDTSGSDLGLDGYFDNVVVDASGDVVTYDFEPALSPSTKDDCKKDGWMNFNAPAFKNQGQCVAWSNHND